MRRDAEAHAKEDKERRELIDLKNQADHVIHQTEKQLAEHKSKVPESDASAIEAAIEALKKAKEGEDKDAIQRALADLSTKAQKLGEAIYKQSASQTAGGPETGGQPEAGAGAKKPSDEPVDADFEVKT